MKFSSLLVCISFLASCGYQWIPEYPDGQRPTVCVPFACGDEEGFLTTEIISSLNQSGVVDVVSSNGDYVLNVVVKDCQTDMIGFRIVPQKVDGEVRNNLRPSEGRRRLTVEANLSSGGEVIFGPYLVVADADYDYVDGDSIQDLTFVNPRGITQTVLPFSLGQLEPIDSAEAAVLVPLYRNISQKIVDAISSEW